MNHLANWSKKGQREIWWVLGIVLLILIVLVLWLVFTGKLSGILSGFEF